MNSKSDAVLAANLEGSKPPRATSTTKPARATSTARKSTSGDEAEGDATPSNRVRVPAGTKPSGVLAIYYPNKDDLNQAMAFIKGDEPGAATTRKNGEVIDKLAKKVGEKAVNLIRALRANNPAGVQVYTKLALDHLIENGTMTTKELVGVYAAVPYKDGTQRAQSNQIMQLFPALGIAERTEKSTLKLHRGSPLYQQYRKESKKATAEA